jgi:hypothetical protein
MGLGVVFTLCTPIRFHWDKFLGASGKCVDIKPAELGTAVVIVAADFMILFLPMPMLWSLQITRARKLLLCILFGIGFMWAKAVLWILFSFLAYGLISMQCYFCGHGTDSIYRQCGAYYRFYL